MTNKEERRPSVVPAKAGTQRPLRTLIQSTRNALRRNATLFRSPPLTPDEIWFEQHGTMDEAILREKRVKKWNRAWKIALIQDRNPYWDDLAIGLGFERLPD